MINGNEMLNFKCIKSNCRIGYTFEIKNFLGYCKKYRYYHSKLYFEMLSFSGKWFQMPLIGKVKLPIDYKFARGKVRKIFCGF